MIKAEAREENGGLRVEVECEGMMHEIMAQTTQIVNSIARSMEEKKEGSGSDYLQGIKIGMALGLFSLELPEDPPAGPCPQGPEGEPGALGG